MLIAHLPAGYLLTRRTAPRLAKGRANPRRLVAVGLTGSVLPDIDLLYFYLADGRQTLHHDYWTHIPAFWPAATLIIALLMMLARVAVPWRGIAVFLSAIFLHLTLDSVAGGITWGWPVSQQRFSLIEVPARFDWWVWSFVLHWSFLFEIAICLWAAREFQLLRRLRDLKRIAATRNRPRAVTRRSEGKS